MVKTFGNDIISVYTGGVQVKEIWSNGVKVWPVTPTPTPPNNEIWYTSTDGNIVTPYITTSFGANIVSNTYVDGYGVIEFDGPVLAIGVYHFKDCVKLESISLPSSVTEIASRSFEGCTGLISITIPPPPASNIYIGNGAFDGCTGLTSVTIPESVSRLGQSIFYGCTGLTSIMIPSSVTNVGVAVLSGCPNLSSITVDMNNTVYDSRNSCDAIIETSTNTLIQGCKNTVIPSSVTSIEQGAFYGVELTSIIIPSSVTSIGYQAFAYCNRLTSITIPSSVNNIRSRSFYGCSRLSEVVVEAVVPPALGTADVFTSTASTLLIKVPSGSVETYKTSTGWSDYASRIVAQD